MTVILFLCCLLHLLCFLFLKLFFLIYYTTNFQNKKVTIYVTSLEHQCSKPNLPYKLPLQWLNLCESQSLMQSFSASYVFTSHAWLCGWHLNPCVSFRCTLCHTGLSRISGRLHEIRSVPIRSITQHDLNSSVKIRSTWNVGCNQLQIVYKYPFNMALAHVQKWPFKTSTRNFFYQLIRIYLARKRSLTKGNNAFKAGIRPCIGLDIVSLDKYITSTFSNAHTHL